MGIGYKGLSDNICEKEGGFISEWQNASQRRYDMSTIYEKLKYVNTSSYKHKFSLVKCWRCKYVGHIEKY